MSVTTSHTTTAGGQCFHTGSTMAEALQDKETCQNAY